MTTRPQDATLGSFSGADAPRVAQTLSEKKISFKQTQGNSASSFVFTVASDKVDDARLALVELNLDPTTSIWSPDTWANRQSWSNTDFDKRQLQKEQMESNIAKGLMTLSVVERAKVVLALPTATPLFKEDIKPVTAGVTIQPIKGQQLSAQTVRGIMDYVAAQVEGLEPKNVTVMDASASRIVSEDVLGASDPAKAQAAQQQELSNGLLSIQQEYQNRFQSQIKQQLEVAFGPGNVSVIVNPVINWDKVLQQATEYKGAGPNGQGIPLSTQKTSESSDGTTGTGGQSTPAGTPSNSEAGIPSYPGSTPSTGGNISTEKKNEIINFLVNETKTTTEKPGGVLESVNVGILVNSAKVNTPDLEQRVNAVVSTAMGPKAQVQLAAVPFAASIFDSPATPAPDTGSRELSMNWLYWVLGIGLGLGGVAAFFAFTKPKRPVLEPVFAGPEAAMMGGIPITDLELPPPVAAAAAEAPPEPAEKRLPETAEEVMALPPEEVAALADEFLHSLGVDPAKVRMKEKVEKIAKVQPEAVANLLKHWINTERE